MSAFTNTIFSQSLEMVSEIYLPGEIPEANPGKKWPRDHWKKSFASLKTKSEWRGGQIRSLFDWNKAQLRLLKKHITYAFRKVYSSSAWPEDRADKEYARPVLNPVLKKWGLAFNIPVTAEIFYDMLYDTLKQIITSERRRQKRSQLSGQGLNRNFEMSLVQHTPVPKLVLSPSNSSLYAVTPRPMYLQETIVIAFCTLHSNDPFLTLPISDVQSIEHNESPGIVGVDERRLVERLQDTGNFNPLTEKLAISLPGHRLDGSCVDHTHGLRDLIQIAVNRRCNPIIFHVIHGSRQRFEDIESPIRRMGLYSRTVPMEQEQEHRAEGQVDNTMVQLDRAFTINELVCQQSGGHASDRHFQDIGEIRRLAKLAVSNDENPSALGVHPSMDLVAQEYDRNRDKHNHTRINRSISLSSSDSEPDQPVSVSTTHLDVDLVHSDIMDCCDETEHVTMGYWNLMCDLFKRNPSDHTTPIVLTGIKRSLPIHQALAIVFCLNHHIYFHGGIIGDESGLGKTTTAMVLCYINHLIEQNEMDVSKAYDEGLNTHCTYSSPRGSKCPSREQWPIQCCCEPGSASARFRYRAGMNLYITPPGMTETARDEFRSLFGSERGGAMELVVGHSGEPVTSNGGDRDTTAWNIKAARSGTRLNLHTDSNTKMALPGQTKYIILSTYGSVESEVYLPLQRYKMVRSVSQSQGIQKVLRPGPHFIVSILIVDEMHLNKNCNNTFHKHFLSGSDRKDIGDPYLWAMSGTPIQTGPKDIIAYVRYLEMQWQRTRLQHVPPPIKVAYRRCSVADLMRTQTEIDQSIKNSFKPPVSSQSNPYLGNNRETVRLGSKEGVSFHGALKMFKHQLHYLMIRRTSETRGVDKQSLIPLPPLLFHRTNISLTLRNQVYLTRYIENTKNALHNGFERTRNDWKRSGYRGARPIWPKIDWERAQYTVRPVCSFPALGRLQEEGCFPHGWNLDAIANAGWFHPTTYSPSPIRDNIERLHESSAKLKWLDKLVADMKDAGNRHHIVGKHHKDKLVILSAFPINTLIIYEWLRRKFPDKCVALYGSHLSSPHRQSLLHRFQEVISPGGDEDSFEYMDVCRPDILIGTIGSLGTGLGLHSAHQLVIFEPQSFPSTVERAKGRVHGIGQTRPVAVHMLVTAGCQVEQMLVNKAEMKKFIAGILHQPTVPQSRARARARAREPSVVWLSSDDEEDYDDCDRGFRTAPDWRGNTNGDRFESSIGEYGLEWF